MAGRSLRARAPVNYKGEEGGTNTPNWLKASSRFSSGNAAAESTAKSDKDKENVARTDRKISKQPSPTSPGRDNKDKPAGNKRSKKKSADAVQQADQSVQPLEDAAAAKSDVFNLLTPVDLLKKSSSNRLKQKQAKAQAQAETADVAEPADTKAPAAAEAGAAAAVPGKKVATRGRNANLQVVEVEPKAKQGKRKAAADKTQQSFTDLAPGTALEQEQSDSETLPNRKRAKPSKSAPKQQAAAVTSPKGQPAAASAAFKDVPGLPGVRHQIPQLNGTAAESPVQAPAFAQLSPADKVNAEGKGRKGAAKSGNNRQQADQQHPAGADPVSPAQATVSQTAATLPDAKLQPQAVDQPADRCGAGAQQNTLATGSAQGVQFQTLQAHYAQLQQKYADLKEKKINDLDTLLEEHSAHLATHNETAVKLAEHWRQEAHRQAAFAQAAGAPAMQEELRKDKEEVQRLKAALLEQEAAVLQRDRQLADLRKELKDALCKAEPPMQRDQALQCAPLLQHDQETQTDFEGMQQETQQPAQLQSEATPMHGREAGARAGQHLEEAKALCPEGREATDSYHQAGLQGSPSIQGSGRVMCDTAAKPLVPYPVGVSGQGRLQQPRRSRLAESHGAEQTPGHQGQLPGKVQINTAAKPLVPYSVGISVQPQPRDRTGAFAEGPGAAKTAMTPHPIQTVHQSPVQVHEPEQSILPELSLTATAGLMVPRAVALANGTALPLPASPQHDSAELPARHSHNAKGAGCHLEYPSEAVDTGGAVTRQTHARGGEAMEMDMSLTGSAQEKEAQVVSKDALHALMGLEATPIHTGGFKYIHRNTGLIFEIAPATPDDEDDGEANSAEPEFCFNPVALGKAVLPPYLRTVINVAAHQRQTLVGRVMEALGKTVIHQD